MRSCKTSRTPTSFRHLHCFNFFQHQVVKLSSTVYLPRSEKSLHPIHLAWIHLLIHCNLAKLDPTKGRSISPSQQPRGTKLTPPETKMQAENNDFQLGTHGISSSRGLYMQKPLQSHPTMASTSTIGSSWHREKEVGLIGSTLNKGKDSNGASCSSSSSLSSIQIYSTSSSTLTPGQKVTIEPSQPRIHNIS